MSQLMICRTKSDLTGYGHRITEISSIPRQLLSNVVDRYFDGNIEDLWFVDSMNEWINDLTDHLDNIKELADKSEKIITWYSDMYLDLDKVSSVDELLQVIVKASDEICPELYICFEK